MTPVLYHHPISTTSRPLMMFADEHELALDWRVVDLMQGQQQAPDYLALNPNGLVPLLVDGDFRLTESAAILRHLATRYASPAYPSDARGRARVDEVLDWLNTQLMRELAYGLAYPQLFPHLRRPDARDQQAVLDWARPRAEHLLGLMDRWLLGDGRPFLTSGRISLADYFGLAILTLGEAAGVHYGRWPNLNSWLARMKARPSYARTHGAFEAFVRAVAPAEPVAA
jgi:glutathione S-transferase